MKDVMVLLGLLSATSALDVAPTNRPFYNFTIAERKVRLGQDQCLYCYDQPNCEGIRITIGTTPVPDLGAYPYYFDNRIVSCNYNGIYILYDERNYNQDNLQGAVYAEAWGENKCVNMDGFANKATSISLTGNPRGWRYDSINFYEGEFYNGREQYSYGDAASFQYDKFGKSMIITGCSAWTLYEYSYYRGQSACWYPADTSNCYPSFFRNTQMMNGWDNQVSSVRHGCFSKQKFYGKPLTLDNSAIQIKKGSNGHFFNI